MMCWNKKTLAVVAVGALAVLAFAPSAFGRALPLLLMAACPLGMLLMARGAAGAYRRENDRPGTAEAASPARAEAEIARLREELERLRAGETTAPRRRRRRLSARKVRPTRTQPHPGWGRVEP